MKTIKKYALEIEQLSAKEKEIGEIKIQLINFYNEGIGLDCIGVSVSDHNGVKKGDRVRLGRSDVLSCMADDIPYIKASLGKHTGARYGEVIFVDDVYCLEDYSKVFGDYIIIDRIKRKRSEIIEMEEELDVGWFKVIKGQDGIEDGSTIFAHAGLEDICGEYFVIDKRYVYGTKR